MNIPSENVRNLKRLDADSYDKTAAGFDKISERFVAPLALTLLELARLNIGDHVLDVGSGSGLVALRAAPLVPNGQVTAIDHAQKMLEQAAAKASRLGLGKRVQFQQMDAEKLEFGNSAFDKVLSLYALPHFPEPLRALSEMHRVLKPGGQLVVGIGSRPPLFSWNGVVQSGRWAADQIGAARGLALTAPDYLRQLMIEHGIASANALPTNRRLQVWRLLRQAGFTRIARSWQGRCEDLNTEEFWEVQAVYGSSERVGLQQISIEDLKVLKEEFALRCQRVKSNGGRLIYRHAAMFYTATRV